MLNTTLPDLLRLVVIPVFGWAAWQDIRTRRIPNRLWVPLLILGGGLIVWEAIQLGGIGVPGAEMFALRVGLSLALVGGGSFVLWWFGGFGAADAKALITIAVLLPTVPSYTVGGVELPLVTTVLGIFSLTVLTNGVLVGGSVPLAVCITNILRGDINRRTLLFARRVRVDSLPHRHGRLSENQQGITRNGLDIDVLRMYLRWRELSLAGLRTTPEARSPETITDTHDPTDGRSGVQDDIAWDDPSVAPENGETPPPTDIDDPWGVDRFFDEIEQTTYRTDREELRDGLELLATTDQERVWVAPGVPFVAPLFGGLIIASTYGDLLFGYLDWLQVV